VTTAGEPERDKPDRRRALRLHHRGEGFCSSPTGRYPNFRV